MWIVACENFVVEINEFSIQVAYHTQTSYINYA